MLKRCYLAIVLASAAPSFAQAQQSAEDMARAHFMSASAYYEQGRYEDAARAFMESYRLAPRAELLDNAARAFERALLFNESIQTLEQLISQHPEYRDEATLRERISNLERLRERVAGGGNNQQQQQQQQQQQPVDSGGGGGGISIPGIILLAVGGAIGVGAIITGVVADGIYQDLDRVCVPNNVCPMNRRGDIDTGNALAITSTVMTFTSAAALAVGVVLMIVEAVSGSSDQAALELVPGPGEAGLGARLRF